MAKEMAEKFYIADESLGGIEREYVKSDKNAEVGDYVVLLRAYYDSYAHLEGEVFEVISVETCVETPDGTYDVVEVIHNGLRLFVVEYATLSPTGNVRIDGERIFRMVDRKAEVGEKVIVVEDFAYGECGEIHEIHEDSRHNFSYRTDKAVLMNYSRCRVLEPVEPEANPDVADILANLAQEVVKLRKQVEALSEQTDSNAKDIVTFAEKATEAKHDSHNNRLDIVEIYKSIEMLSDDIVLLDERTHPEELAETVLGNITIRRAGGIRNGQSIYSY